jgi:hypothetical protein
MRSVLPSLFSAIVAVVLTHCLIAEPIPAALEEIISRNTEAMGGTAKLESVQAIEVSLHIKDPDFEMDGIYHAARPGKMRIDIVADGKPVYMERFDGEKGWQWNGKEEKEECATPTAALRHGIELPGNLYGLHEMRKRGNGLELAGREKVDGVEYYVLHMTFEDGNKTSLFVDPQSWRITRRREVRALHPDIDPTPTTIETRYSDYRSIDGLWFSFSSQNVDLQTGKVLETVRVKTIKVNPAIDPAIFTRRDV